MAYLPIKERLCTVLYGQHSVLELKLFDKKTNTLYAHCLVCDKEWITTKAELKKNLKSYYGS